MQDGYKKNAGFDADFEYIEKAAKNVMQKSYQQKSVRKMGFWLFYCVKKFFIPSLFLCDFLALFPTDSNTASNMGFMTPYKSFEKIIFFA